MISLLKIIKEWTIRPLSKGDIKRRRLANAPLLNLKLGKWDIDKGQRGFEYSWDEALNNKDSILTPNIISSATADRVIKICNKLGITPEKVYIGWYVDPYELVDSNGVSQKDVITYLKSTYILAYYKNEPIIFAQRQVRKAMSGQFYVYSKYKKSGKAARAGDDRSEIFMDRNATKEQILDFLKIKDNTKTVYENQIEIEIKNPDYYKQLVDQTNFSPNTKKYYYGLIAAVKKQGNRATPNQYHTLQQIKKGKS